MPRLFTLEEARLTLAQVRPAVEEMTAQKARLDQLRAMVAMAGDRRPGGFYGGSAITDYAGLAAAQTVRLLNRIVHELVAAGIEIKDVDRGLIDFRSVQDDRIVYLCWMAGEPELDWYHELAAGFSGRRPIPEHWKRRD